MKIIAFSDVHGNQYAFRSFMKQIKSLEHDYLFFCGDIHGYYYGQEEIVQQMKKMKKLYAVKGNHDKIASEIACGKKSAEPYLLQYGHSYEMLSSEAVEYVEHLPKLKKLEIEGKKIAILHGTFSNLLEGRLYPKDMVEDEMAYRQYDYVFCGHTHFQMIKWIGNTMIINAGSLGQQRDGKGFCFVYVDTQSGLFEYRKIFYDTVPLEAEVKKYDPENQKMIEILHRGEI